MPTIPSLFNFALLLYLNQGVENTGWLNTRMVTASAASIPGLDVPQLLDQRNSATTKSQAGSFDRLATRDRVSATPTILVGRSGHTPGQVALSSPADAHSVAVALDRALR